MTDVTFPLDFTGGSLPANVSLTRGSAGYYYNSSGTPTSASSNVARFDYNPATLALRGLLIEPAVTNECGKSHDFTAATLQDATKTDAQTGPDGGSDATLLKPANTHWGHYMFNTGSGSAGLYAHAVYAKASGYTTVGMTLNETKNVQCRRVKFDLSGVTHWMGQGIMYASIQQCASSWYRCCAVIYEPQWSNVELSSWPAPTNTSWTDMGNGDTTQGAVFWGETCELVPVPWNNPYFATSYIATTGGASATRSADVCTFSIGAGVGHLVYTFDDNTTQTIACATGAYTVPTNLNRPWIKTINGIA